MPRTRVYVGLTTREYADAHGISLRAAQRRVPRIPGAVKSGRGWRIPIPAADYARKTGKSASSVRRKGFRAVDIEEEMKKRYPGTLREQAADHRATLVAGKPSADGNAIIRRLGRATSVQLRRILGTHRESDFSYRDPFWNDDDGVSVVFYHAGK